jgi:hypothetical protein
MTLSISEIQYCNALPLCSMSRFSYYYAECRVLVIIMLNVSVMSVNYTECHYAECQCDEC